MDMQTNAEFWLFCFHLMLNQAC